MAQATKNTSKTRAAVSLNRLKDQKKKLTRKRSIPSTFGLKEVKFRVQSAQKTKRSSEGDGAVGNLQKTVKHIRIIGSIFFFGIPEQTQDKPEDPSDQLLLIWQRSRNSGQPTSRNYKRKPLTASKRLILLKCKLKEISAVELYSYESKRTEQNHRLVSLRFGEEPSWSLGDIDPCSFQNRETCVDGFELDPDENELVPELEIVPLDIFEEEESEIDDRDEDALWMSFINDAVGQISSEPDVLSGTDPLPLFRIKEENIDNVTTDNSAWFPFLKKEVSTLPNIRIFIINSDLSSPFATSNSLDGRP
ncbi:hypothetical protein PGTUg99_003534 [Puccinia graminis f. sp. tritici]|uniref:Uncharacterized protein n=1 Tax=Puccinia graminis f. sp. tritici TaxID=56615 RepID=A0A5B0MSL7_PUCGR|nr:hypothetical protein PGTUg99_003534 [Puccinia graminis f. sp. tritici]